MSKPALPIFDGHNDTLLRLEMARRNGAPISFVDGHPSLQIDLPKATKGHFAGGLFAMFVPPILNNAEKNDPVARQKAIEASDAVDWTLGMIAEACRLERASNGRVRICRSRADIKQAMADEALALMLHIEGAEAIGADFNALEAFYAAGLRSLGPVWSRDNIFGAGVPFDFPGSPDHGPGLSDLGKELVRRCNQLGVMIDLSHLNEKGFWDVQKLSDKPLVASHSNVHKLSQSRRNLTDKQLDAIAESKGLVGLNYAVGFLRSDGEKFKRDVSLDLMVDHLAYLVEKLGEDGVGLGSDYDGATVPDVVADVSLNQKLIDHMRHRGFGETLVEKIAFKNWLGLLERTGI
ncbi:dipeptidase [Cohaesibacter intestini]|uniref:dipeptidase n=1 Tax=Cohaesibacter intestini TaxID=2211145 RepID=UPI000DEBEF3E|nr:dipeptidase [Cohaesibacter intestini]